MPRGWMGYYVLSEYYRSIPKHDHWLRRRIRMCYWHLSKTFATQVGMTNQWLKKQGLISIKELWISFHYPNKTR
ncbi:MAG: hypothetical protein GY777_00935 [Candidatus Brocadiaceae bacterium]|nr:hypothetical protein [Candidatus Brocadiaceae bacterium]